MFESLLYPLHDFIVMAYVDVIVEAHKRVRLVAYRFSSLPWPYHQRKHLGVAVCIVRLEVATAYLPGAKQFGGIVCDGPESVDRRGGKFFAGHIPHLFESRPQIGLRVVRCTESDEFTIGLQEIVPSCPRAIGWIEPFVVVSLHHLLFVEMAVDDPYVVLDPLIPL